MDVNAERKKIGLAPYKTLYSNDGIEITGLKTKFDAWELHCTMDKNIKTHWKNRWDIIRVLPDNCYCYADNNNKMLQRFLRGIGAERRFQKWVGVGRSVSIWIIKGC